MLIQSFTHSSQWMTRSLLLYGGLDAAGRWCSRCWWRRDIRRSCRGRTITRPELGASDRADRFATHRCLWLYLSWRPLSRFRWGSLSERASRKKQCDKPDQWLHNPPPELFPVFSSPLNRATNCARNPAISRSNSSRSGPCGSFRAVASSLTAISSRSRISFTLIFLLSARSRLGGESPPVGRAVRHC